MKCYYNLISTTVWNRFSYLEFRRSVLPVLLFLVCNLFAAYTVSLPLFPTAKNGREKGEYTHTHNTCRLSAIAVVHCQFFHSFGSKMDTSPHSKPSSSSASQSSHSPSPAPVTAPRKTRDSGLCMTQDIPEIPTHCIDNLNSHQLGRGIMNIGFRPAAIKYSSPIHLATLIREAKVMWALRDHSNIIKIYGLYRDARHGQGVVMEYMDCGSMSELIYDRKSIDYTIDHVASWLYQMASAVNTFHRNDQVHRDLKLQNMLLCDRYRTMKLCDFGTFTAMHQSMTSNRGTPITMAPEVFRCEEYNQKSDIYSIGIIMWQMIARNHPYNRNLSVPGLLYNVATASLRPPELDCNPILSDFYKQCWHDDPVSRPTAAECLQYFTALKTEYPNGNVPLADANTNRPVETPPPRVHRPSGLGSASGSGLGTNGRTPTASNHLNAPQAVNTHRRNRSETIQMKPELPYPVMPGEVAASSSGAFRGPRSQSEAKNLRDAGRSQSGQRHPHRNAPPIPIDDRRDSNESNEKDAIFMELLRNDDTRPVDPDARDEASLDIFHQHCSSNKEYADALLLKKEVLRAKHELLSRWPQHQRHVELLERQNYLEQEIAKLEYNSDDDFSITERL
ncbi:hypothetical protein L5515_000872 [Caenorhabditis briggsae]|uniref:Protein kinase domain-containing protein n=1 Tax=Caenorhabditis briggsae TaxID=6238 RepID=A0AAE9J386_CAEBR|nr:hypothetical protein L5515_000872 [Caenorhabditis briggsae]